jgi:hypothetical protein
MKNYIRLSTFSELNNPINIGDYGEILLTDGMQCYKFRRKDRHVSIVRESSRTDVKIILCLYGTQVLGIEHLDYYWS